MELECPAVARALGVFTGPEAEVEAGLDQVGDVAGLWVESKGSRSHDEIESAKGSGFFPLDWEIFNPIHFELPGKAPVHTGVSLGVGRLFGVG